MTTFLLAQTNPTDPVVGNPHFMRLEFLHYGTVAAGIALLLFSVFALLLSSIWLVRTARRVKLVSDRSNSLGVDDSMQQVVDARAHLDASKRHLAALEQKLGHLQDQLKHRPAP